MARLSFKISEVQKIVKVLENSKEFSPTYDGLYDIDCPIKPGVQKRTEDTLPYKPDEIDFSKIEPAFHLVKDSGIYLLSNSRDDDKPASESGIISYAKGFDPDDASYSWEKTVDAVGGDDFVTEIPLSWFYHLIKQKPNAKVFSINVSPTSISLNV